jgi:hypothetical protein
MTRVRAAAVPALVSEPDFVDALVDAGSEGVGHRREPMSHISSFRPRRDGTSG